MRFAVTVCACGNNNSCLTVPLMDILADRSQSLLLASLQMCLARASRIASASRGTPEIPLHGVLPGGLGGHWDAQSVYSSRVTGRCCGRRILLQSVRTPQHHALRRGARQAMV